MKIPLMKNAFLNEKDTRRVVSEFLLGDEQLSMGKKCAAFEKSFADVQSRGHARLFNSGGSANLALLQALKNIGRLAEGDHVGFSALTWSTNVMPIIQLGLVPVPIDCERDTLNVSSRTLSERLQEISLKALFITNVLGFVDDLDAVQHLCAEKGILLLEDNCESLGTELPSGRTGNFGFASTFSFFVAHHLSTIEGGMVCTDDDSLADMLTITRANGWDRNLSSEKQQELRAQHHISSELYGRYTFYDLGYNLRPTEITGVIGLQQLPHLEETVAARYRTFCQVASAAARNPDFIPMRYDHIKTLSPFALPFVCRTQERRDFYVNTFSQSGIELRPMIAGNMQRQPFYKKYVTTTYHLPNTDFVHDNGFYCGNYPEMTPQEVETIVNCIS